MMIYYEFHTLPTIVPYSARAKTGVCSSSTANGLMASKEKDS